MVHATDPPSPRAGRLRPPGAPLGTIPRPATSARLSGEERVVLVVAPPGYGKTETVRQWSEAASGPVAWLPVDLLDESPSNFWAHLVQALSTLAEDLDDEPALLLAERGPADPVFLDALVASVERTATQGALVIDDAWRLTDRTVTGGLAQLIERIGHLVRFVIVDRADPPFPTALWRSRGWVAEIRADDLRFSEQDAIRVAGELPGLVISDAAVIALNARAEGWPIGLHVALVTIASEPEPESRAHAIASSDRLLLDFLVSEVLDALPNDERDVALALSVLVWFDSDLCIELLGRDALPAVDKLRRRRLFLTTVDNGIGDRVRFHPLFRELLENELRWRDPARRLALHRRAAEIWRARGDLTAAYHHLVTIGDLAQATDLVLPVAVALVDGGGVRPLAEHMRRLPDGMQVEDASHAFDLALAWAFAGGRDEAVRWNTVAQQLVAADGSSRPLRTHATGAVIDLLQGSITTAWEHVRRFDRCGAGDGPREWQMPAFGARAALLTGRTAEARAWIDRAAVGAGPQSPSAAERVVFPALWAWWELEEGALARARVDADAVVDEVERLGMRPHLGALDAMALAAQCRIGTGQLAEAEEILEPARADAAELGWTLPLVRVGLLVAEVARLRTGASASLAALDDLRHSIRSVVPAPLARWITGVEAAALIACARFADARTCIEGLDDTPRTRLLRARLAVASRSREPLGTLLDDRGRWSTALRLEGEVLVALAGGDDGAKRQLTAAIVEGHETGWVSPFLDVVDLIRDRLGSREVEQAHPPLARAVPGPPPARQRADAALVEPLTPREVTLLELLPTHLSYAEIGGRLYLSVNTIKSNLKAIYRKLGVTSRAEAVETAWRLGLLEPFTPGGAPSAAGTPRH